MSDYTVQANWSEKDALPSGDANKRVRASEHATEYAAIASAIASKADQSDVDLKASQASFSSTVATVLDLTNRVVSNNAPSTLLAGDTPAHLTFTDNVKAKFGTSGDGLEIFHDGTDSILKDAGTGILKYTSETNVAFGSVFQIENTSATANAGAYISFKGDTNDTPVKIGSEGSNTFQMVLNDAESHSFTPDSLKFKDGNNEANIIVGTGTPETNVSAPIGSLFLRTNGSTGSTLYVKESGSGNTGWVALGGS